MISPTDSEEPKEEIDIRLIDGRAPVDELGVLLFEIIVGIKRPKGFTTKQALKTMPPDDAVRCRNAGKLVASMIEQAFASGDLKATHNAVPSGEAGDVPLELISKWAWEFNFNIADFEPALMVLRKYITLALDNAVRGERELSAQVVEREIPMWRKSAEYHGDGRPSNAAAFKVRDLFAIADAIRARSR